MTINEWRPSSTITNGYRALEHKITKELAWISKYGDIWQYSNDVYKVVVNSSRVAKKVGALVGKSIKIGPQDEVIISFPKELFSQVAKLIYLKKRGCVNGL